MNKSEKDWLEVIEQARLNLVNYRHIFLAVGDDECQPADFHFEWSDILLNGTGNFAIEAFRESAKTQYVLRAFPFYCLSFPAASRDYIVIIKNNTPLAQAKLKEIEHEFESNPALQANIIKIREKSGSVLSVDVKDGNGKRNIRIEAYGKGSSIRGLANIDRRPKIVIVDDPQDLEDSKSDTVLASDWDWFLSDVMFLGQSTRIFMIGNNLGDKCIIERVSHNPEELGFQFKRLPIIEGDEPTWPDKYTKEGIEAEKKSYQALGKLDVWLRERMCQAVADETRVFKPEYFRYYNPVKKQEIAERSNVFMLVDPATSTSTDSDYRAILVIAVDEDGQWFILDCSYGRYDSKVLIDEIFRLAVEWEVREVGIESGALKGAIQPFIEPEMRRRNQFFTIVPVKHGGVRKPERIRILQPRFANGMIFFPERAEWLPELEAELLAFTMDGMKGMHDDLIDALAYTEQIARVPFRTGKDGKSKRYQELPRVAEMETSLI